MSRSRLLIVLLSVACLGAAAFAMWGGDDPEPLPDYGLEIATGPDEEALDGEDLSAAAGEAEQHEGVTDPLQLPNLSSGREELEGEDGTPKTDFVLQVFSGKKGVPAPGAEVFFVELGPGGWARVLGRGRARGPRSRAPIDPFAEHWSDVAVRDGQKFKTDAKGQVRLPQVENMAILAAQREGQYGFSFVRRRHKKVETVILLADETVVVRVVDESGDGVAGVPIGLHQRVPTQPRLEGQLASTKQNIVKLKQMLQSRGRTSGEQMAGMREKLAHQLNQARNQARRLQRGGGDSGSGKNAAAPRAPGIVRPEFNTVFRLRRRTDENGNATLRHFQLYRLAPQKWWKPGQEDRYVASLLMPLSDRVAVEFVGRPTPKDPVTLRMPPTGTVSLHLVDATGAPWVRAANAELYIVDENSAAIAKLSPSTNRRPGGRNGKRAGKPRWAPPSQNRVPSRKESHGIRGANTRSIEFPFVGLGLRLRPRVWLDDRDFTWNAVEMDGPLHAGETVTFEVVVAPHTAMIVGFVHDAAGKPLTGSYQTFLVNGRDGKVERESMTLGPGGRFQMPLKVGQHLPPYTFEARHNGSAPQAGLFMPLRELADGRCTDLGQLSLEEIGAITFGVVVDDRGEPIAGASVQLQRERELGGNKPRLAWRDEGLGAVQTDEDGAYHLFTAPEQARYRLRVLARNHVVRHTDPFVIGERSDVQLDRNADLIATLIKPKWLPDRSVKMELVAVLDPKQRRNERLRKFKGQAAMIAGRVKPGLYNLTISIHGFPDPILRVEGIQVRPGQTGPHPRVTNVNLSALVYRFEITAVDGQGQPAKPNGPLLARVVRPGGKEVFLGFPWRGAKVEVFSASPELEVWALAHGFQVERSVITHGPSQLLFRRLPPVHLVTAGLRAKVGEKMTVRVSMVLVGDSGLPQSLQISNQKRGRLRNVSRAQLSKSSGAWLGKTDSMQIPLMRGGKYRVVARLREAGAGSVDLHLGTVDVVLTPGAAAPRVQVAVPAAKVQQALAKVAAQKAAKAAAREKRRLEKLSGGKGNKR